MSAPWRLAQGGRIDRDRRLAFTFDDRACEGLRGDTLASALLAAGVRVVSRSIRFGRPRGVYAAGIEEPNALVELGGATPESMATATTVELYDGLVARGLPGRGRLAANADRRAGDRMHRHCDVLVVGGGPAGMAAALAAGRSGARVILADDGSELGGSLLGSREEIDGASAADWVAEATAALGDLPEVDVLTRTTVLGRYDANDVIALERRTDHLGADAPAHLAGQRLWDIRAAQIVLAAGAHERSIAFAGNDRPGVMLAGAARTYVNRYAVAPGRLAVVFTTHDGGYAAALDLAHAGVAPAAVVDARPAAPDAWARRCRDAGIDVLAGHVVTRTHGGDALDGVTVARLDAGRRLTSGGRDMACDTLLVSGGWSPTLDLFSHALGALRFDDAVGAFVPAGAASGMEVAGGARGLTGLGACLLDGAHAGARAARTAGFDAPLPSVPAADEAPASPPAALWVVPEPGDGEPWTTHFVDLARDTTVADVRRATGAGMCSSEHVKRYTTLGTAHDQGKTSGTLAMGVLADALGVAPGDVGAPRHRPPYAPVSFAAIAGRDRGRLHDPIRVTALHKWHEAHGAEFEDVGQWKRARHYPRDAEDMEAAVLRECRAVRTGVALMDASTLGKIDVHGPDAAEFLDRMYTNLMSTLKVGAIRYGVMCRADGMVFDDGTAIRLAEDRYLVTTTTGNAAAVLDWFEEWLQTEWPDLRVHCTSVTDEWATIALAGPRSRAVLGSVAPGLAVGRDEFPFMAWRTATVAGVPARVCRISFSGELAYEINVRAWYATGVWEALVAAGQGDGITPYGTETMHVLRAEKGYPIIGQETDGTVTPQDLGMDWIVSKKKADFVGMRSFTRPDTSRTDRKQLVGLLPVDPQALPAEGSQLVDGEPRQIPAIMLGHVTSSYRSAALGRTFALALLQAGRERIGQTLHACARGTAVPVTVTEPVLYDPEGSRRDG
ncbi:Sarcosine oxidase subunit alpha [Capillimicrobium parvum]|uniref:Sarcosine oxidase subunit alpha n=1 Tax=Capillimicrobium parvum TaxID=2884022 RepID=A0A9E6XYN5_9ACTN|nr:2Fe-2S iron-sulfur cluster-binding protein [Capillimicrobium parvum]UGS37052.1 Sarcosine oxidase subunit alpha [Capillimicrobium parvum]